MRTPGISFGAHQYLFDFDCVVVCLEVGFDCISNEYCNYLYLRGINTLNVLNYMYIRLCFVIYLLWVVLFRVLVQRYHFHGLLGGLVTLT